MHSMIRIVSSPKFDNWFIEFKFLEFWINSNEEGLLKILDTKEGPKSCILTFLIKGNLGFQQVDSQLFSQPFPQMQTLGHLQGKMHTRFTIRAGLYDNTVSFFSQLKTRISCYNENALKCLTLLHLKL